MKRNALVFGIQSQTINPDFLLMPPSSAIFPIFKNKTDKTKILFRSLTTYSRFLSCLSILLGLLSDKPPSHSIGRDLHSNVNDHLYRRVQGRYLFWLSASHVKREIFSKWRKKNEIIDLTTFTIRIASIEKKEKKGNECGRSKSRVLHGSRRGNSFLGVNYPKFPIQLLTRIIFHSRVLLNSLPTTSRFIF